VAGSVGWIVLACATGRFANIFATFAPFATFSHQRARRKKQNFWWYITENLHFYKVVAMKHWSQRPHRSQTIPDYRTFSMVAVAALIAVYAVFFLLAYRFSQKIVSAIYFNSIFFSSLVCETIKFSYH
jgi:hypothetical protein